MSVIVPIGEETQKGFRPVDHLPVSNQQTAISKDARSSRIELISKEKPDDKSSFFTISRDFLIRFNLIKYFEVTGVGHCLAAINFFAKKTRQIEP